MRRLSLIFAWYDLWVGVYVDRKARKAYVFPVPMVGVVFDYSPKPEPEVIQLRELVKHCWVHSGYEDCGRRKMTDEQQGLYDSIIEEPIE